MTNKEKFNSLVKKMIEKIESGETGTWFKPWSSGLPQNYMTKKTIQELISYFFG